MSEETTTPEEQAQPPSLKSLLQEQPNPPSEAQIEQWKQQFGEVHLSVFSDDELYIYRPLKRLEWKEVQKQLAQEQDPFKQEELLVDRCVLWPVRGDVPLSLLVKAGTVTTLHEQIMHSSNFLPPQVALNLTQRL